MSRCCCQQIDLCSCLWCAASECITFCSPPAQQGSSTFCLHNQFSKTWVSNQLRWTAVVVCSTKVTLHFVMLQHPVLTRHLVIYTGGQWAFIQTSVQFVVRSWRCFCTQMKWSCQPKIKLWESEEYCPNPSQFCSPCYMCVSLQQWWPCYWGLCDAPYGTSMSQSDCMFLFRGCMAAHRWWVFCFRESKNMLKLDSES
jgi:hypothetical protein